MKQRMQFLVSMLVLFVTACSPEVAITPTATARPSATSTSVPTTEPTLSVTPTPEAQLIEVSGRKLYIHCIGSGSPVVILEAGLGVYSGTWHLVFPEVARFTRVCVYDRFGLGSSEAGPLPRTSERMVGELHELLTKANVAGPYILVGHSFAGLNIQLFASAYPEDVAGIVFVDAVHPELDKRLEPLLTSAKIQERRETLELNPEGITFEDILASEAQVLAAASIPDVPIIVIRHGLPFEGGANWPTAKVEALWAELQEELATLGSQGKVIVAETSHHRIQEDQPDVVIAAIREIFDSVHK